VPSGEATNSNFIVFGLTRSGLKLTIYRSRGEHANHYSPMRFTCIKDISNKTKHHKYKMIRYIQLEQMKVLHIKAIQCYLECVWV